MNSYKIKPKFPEDDGVRFPEELAKESAEHLKKAGYDASVVDKYYVQVNGDIDESELSRWGTIMNSRIIKSDATDDIITPAHSDYFDALKDLFDRFNVRYRDSHVINGGRIFYIEPGQVEFKHPNSGEYVPLLMAQLYADGTVYLSDKKYSGGWSTINIPLEEVFVKVNDDTYMNYLSENKSINSSRKISSSYDTDAAYEEGREAFFNHKTLDNKPITLSKECSEAWEKGWKSAAHSSRKINSGYKISPLEWANRWIPEIYDQRKFMQLCEQKGISEIDSEEFFKLMDEFGFKSNGKTFEYDVSKYLYNSRRPIKSARYIATDPESGEVLGSADTYEEAVDEWGEDVTITDSEAAEGQEDMEGGLFSSYDNKPKFAVEISDYTGSVFDSDYFDSKSEAIEWANNENHRNGHAVLYDNKNEALIKEWEIKSSKAETTKQFITRILSELETGEITEDEAAEEIAEANDVNIGYARQILSNYIADKDRYITSGMLELGEALNVEFDPDGNLDSWSVDFATDPEKPAPTLGGELVRAARYIISAFRDDGEKVGWGYAREVLNPAARFIVENTEYKQNDVFEDLLDGQTYNDDAYRQFIDMFETDFADYLRDHEELFRKLNKKDFTENVNEDDEYNTIDYFSVNNEYVDYWFKYEDGQYVCDNVDPSLDSEWHEGDVITSEDYPFDGIDFNEEYGQFEQDGFIYSWEDGDGESVRISDVEYRFTEFDEGDVLTPAELENLAENGYEFHDTNGNEIRISDIM